MYVVNIQSNIASGSVAISSARTLTLVFFFEKTGKEEEGVGCPFMIAGGEGGGGGGGRGVRALVAFLPTILGHVCQV